jgi:hypothetical protein
VGNKRVVARRAGEAAGLLLRSVSTWSTQKSVCGLPGQKERHSVCHSVFFFFCFSNRVRSVPPPSAPERGGGCEAPLRPFNWDPKSTDETPSLRCEPIPAIGAPLDCAVRLSWPQSLEELRFGNWQFQFGNWDPQSETAIVIGSAVFALGKRSAHGIDCNPRYEAREEESTDTNPHRKC